MRTPQCSNACHPWPQIGKCDALRTARLPTCRAALKSLFISYFILGSRSSSDGASCLYNMRSLGITGCRTSLIC